uniref:Tripartite motif containing 5 n=1 Tax=Sciurus vulgaris TaxID=55149 RepID=A0A8D2AT33_SCIVU
MASAILGDVKEEVTCPICLDLLTQPMSIDCGHSFCQACITSNYESMMSQKGESNCPVCRISYQFEKLRPNRHVANIVERLKGINNVICWLCERSQEHRGHHTYLLEDVAQEYKEMLRKLEIAKEEAEKCQVDIQTKKIFWKNKIQSEVENVQIQFERLRGILNSEEEFEIKKLRNEEDDILNSLIKSENELNQQSQLVNGFISDLENRLQESTVKMLQNFVLKKPEHFPKERRRIFQAPDLKGMLQLSKVHLLLSPSKNPNIVISKDRRQLRYVTQYSRNHRNYHEGVLGYPAITSGKHYWMVDVSKKSAWYLGLCDGRYFESAFTPGQSRHYQPKCGYWVIGLHGLEYNAFGENAAHNPLTLILSVTVPPQCIGVFLDYEACELSFYNVTNHGFLIYKFSRCSFTGEVFPYFNPESCPEPMILH